MRDPGLERLAVQPFDPVGDEGLPGWGDGQGQPGAGFAHCFVGGPAAGAASETYRKVISVVTTEMPLHHVQRHPCVQPGGQTSAASSLSCSLALAAPNAGLLTGTRRIARGGDGDHDRGHAVPAGSQPGVG